MDGSPMAGRRVSFVPFHSRLRLHSERNSNSIIEDFDEGTVSRQRNFASPRQGRRLSWFHSFHFVQINNTQMNLSTSGLEWKERRTNASSSSNPCYVHDSTSKVIRHRICLHRDSSAYHLIRASRMILSFSQSIVFHSVSYRLHLTKDPERFYAIQIGIECQSHFHWPLMNQSCPSSSHLYLSVST